MILRYKINKQKTSTVRKSGIKQSVFKTMLNFTNDRIESYTSKMEKSIKTEITMKNFRLKGTILSHM